MKLINLDINKNINENLNEVNLKKLNFNFMNLMNYMNLINKQLFNYLFLNSK